MSERLYADTVQCSERAILDAVTDLYVAVAKCETVTEVLALKQRISALWLVMDVLDHSVLMKADLLLKTETGL